MDCICGHLKALHNGKPNGHCVAAVWTEGEYEEGCCYCPEYYETDDQSLLPNAKKESPKMEEKSEYRERLTRRARLMLASYGITNDELVENLVMQFAGEDRQSQMFNCPQCGVPLTLKFEMRIKRVRLAEDVMRENGDIPETVTPTPGNGFSPEEIALLEELEASGILGAYADAMNRVVMDTKPKNIRRAFLSWLETAVKVKVPQFALRSLIDEFAGMYLHVYAAQYIAAIVVEDKVMAFYPYHLLKGETISKLTPSGAQITTTKDKSMTVEIWRRAKYGYVCGNGAYFSEMCKKSKGAFANTGV